MMNFTPYQYILLVFMAVWGTSCVPTETAYVDPEGKFFCDISAQLDNENQIIKSELRFYIKDSLGVAPYFLDAPVFMDGKEMLKKFIGHKGVYYTIASERKQLNSIDFLFTNLDDVEHHVIVPISIFDLEIDEKELSSATVLNWRLSKGENIILIDSNKHLFDFKKKNKLNGISKGNAKIVKVVTKDSVYQLKDKLWIKYNSKSLSKPIEIDIVE